MPNGNRGPFLTISAALLSLAILLVALHQFLPGGQTDEEGQTFLIIMAGVIAVPGIVFLIAGLLSKSFVSEE